MVVVGNRPYALSGGVYGDVGRHLAQCGHEALSLVNAACKAVAIYLWHEVQGSHGVLGGGTLVVPLGFYFSLKFGQPVGILLHVGIRGRNTHVVHEDTEVAYAQLVHLLELAHDVADNGTAAQELVARVNGPDEVHLRLLAHLCQVAEHVLCEPAVLLLLGTDGGGVGVLPHL